MLKGNFVNVHSNTRPQVANLALVKSENRPAVLNVLNIDSVKFVLKNCEILHSVRGLYDKYSAS